MIPVKEDGVYAITPDILKKAGAKTDDIDPRSFRMTNRGQEVPIYVSGESDGRFDKRDYIEFYGQKLSGSEYTDTNIYWLSYGGKSGVRMVEEDVSLLETRREEYQIPEQGFRQKVRFEVDNGRFQRYTQDGDPLWFWMRLNAPGLSQIPFDLVNVSDSPENGSVRLMLHGSASERHNMEVFLNAGFRLGDASWFGREKYLLEASNVPNPVFNEGKNAIGIYYPPDAMESKSKQVFLDWIEVEYWQDYKARDDCLEFSNPQNQSYGLYQFELEGFSNPDVELFKLAADGDIRGISKLTDGYIEDKGGGYNLTFQDNVVQPTRYVALAHDKIRFPENIKRDSPSDLRSVSHSADYIVITHSDFYESALAISEFRASQGMRTMVVDVEDIYDEFSYGIFTPIAMRDFIQYAFQNWQKPSPGYVLLLGDASWWYKRDESYVPSYTYNSKVGDPGSEWGPTASDDYFVCVSGDDPLPDLSIGRIPAQNNEQARIAVEKIIEYERNPEPGEWRKSLLFLSGRQQEEPQLIFEAKAEEFINLYVSSDYSISRIYTNPDSPYFGDTSDLLNAINGGHSFVRFAGHGGGSVWSDDDLLNLEDIPLMENKGKLPFIVSWTCFTAWFDNPYTNCLAEEMLFLKDGGAVALFGSTGLGLLYADLYLEEEMCKVIFEKNERVLGRAVAEAKIAFLTRFAGRRDYMDLSATYMLIGDPATRLILPQVDAHTTPQPDLMVSASEIALRETQDSRPKTQDPRPKTQDSGLRTQDVSYVVSVPVHNLGSADARKVTIKLYDSNPFQAGSSEVSSQLIDLLPRSGTFIVSFVLSLESWVLSPESCVFLWVDPLDEIAELNESNNTAQLEVAPNIALVTPEAGSNGARESSDGIFLCSIPEGMVLSQTYLTISQVDISQFRTIQPDVTYAQLPGKNGTAYEIHLSPDTAIADGGFMDISFKYSPDLVTNGERLAIYRRLDTAERWVICDDCAVSEGVVSARVTHLGVYALMINNDTTAPKVDITLKEQGFIHEDFVSSSPQVSIVAEDANGIKDVCVYLDGSPAPAEELSMPGVIGLTPFPVEYHPTLKRGRHTVEVEAFDLNGLSAVSSITITVEQEFRIEAIANRPNPCRRRTLFTYVLTQPADDMTIKIYSSSGRRIRKLDAPASAGYNELMWDLRDEDDKTIANGVYFYKLTARQGGRKVERIGKLAVLK
jgi:hypothetical protein